MTAYLDRRFSKYMQAIQLLTAKDAEFREACANYEEICAWLAERCLHEASSSRECEDAREQMNDLEQEILTLLEKRHDII